VSERLTRRCHLLRDSCRDLFDWQASSPRRPLSSYRRSTIQRGVSSRRVRHGVCLRRTRALRLRSAAPPQSRTPRIGMIR
jgi:hypothetical protein